MAELSVSIDGYGNVLLLQISTGTCQLCNMCLYGGHIIETIDIYGQIT